MSDFLPTNDGDKLNWFQNYKTKLAVRGLQLGQTQAQIDALVSQVDDYFRQHIELVQARAKLESQTAAVRTQETALIALVRKQAGDMKRHSQYTAAVGEDFGIRPQTHAFDPKTYKPKFTATTLPGRVLIQYVKGRADGVNVYCRLRGQTAWRLVGRDSNPPFGDATPLAQANVAEVREYVLRAVIQDEEIGQMSNIVSVAFGG